MSEDDLGKRIAAARCYAGIDLDGLADSIGMTPPALQRIEAGLEKLSETERWALLRAVATSTRLPEQFFTVEFENLTAERPPEQELERLERKIDRALDRLSVVIEEAETQLTRFIEHQEADRELLGLIAQHLGIHRP